MAVSRFLTSTPGFRSPLLTSFFHQAKLGLQTHALPTSGCSRSFHVSMSNHNAPAPNKAEDKKDVVIVGAGIAGLAIAVSLYRRGIRPLVLEQADCLRTSGTSLTLNNNGWKALDAIGVGNQLRSQFLKVQGMEVATDTGKELLSLNLNDVVNSLELRPVERKVLLRTLADQLPPDTVQFSSKLSKIDRAKTGETILELVDGSRLSPNVVIGCDGIRSSVAKWLGFGEPKYAGQCAIRGLGVYPQGQPYRPTANFMYGRGVKAGYVPVSPTKIYWFVIYNDAYPDRRITDSSELRTRARHQIKNWPSEVHSIMENTPNETLILTPLEERWLWPAISPSASSGRVVVAGDAWHPMTPHLGQGACTALEDAMVLSNKLSDAITLGQESIEGALESYEKDRWSQVSSVTIRASLAGVIQHSENPIVCYIRNNFVIPRLHQVYQFQKHAQ